jgi:hypothetical protein
MAPLTPIVTPINKNERTYDLDKSYIRPHKGGPIAVAKPWNIINSPNEFVIFSNPNKSTRSNDVTDT